MFVRFFASTTNKLYIGQCLFFLALLVLTFSLMSPHFLSMSNFGNILTASAAIGLLALGATFVIASGGIDLSSAAVMALAGTVCATALQQGQMSPYLAIPIGIGTGALCGFVTGLLINMTKAPSFIVTLGIMSVARALAYIVSGGVPIYGLPESVVTMGHGNLVGIPAPALILLAGILFAYILLSKTRFGLHALILGDNTFAAEALGIPATKLRLKIFTLAGVYSGLAGIVFTLRTNSGDPTAGNNYELIAITAVILGGANLFGGHATIIGTILGVFCLGVLQNGLNLLAVDTYYQILFVGLVLLTAAFLARLGMR